MFTKDRLRIICENKRPPDVSLILGRDLQTRTRWRLIPARKQHNTSPLPFPFHPSSWPIPVVFSWQEEQLFFWILSDYLKLEDWYPQPPRDVSSPKSWEGYSPALHPITNGYKTICSVYLVSSFHADRYLHHCFYRFWGRLLRMPRPWAEAAKESSDKTKMYRTTPQIH